MSNIDKQALRERYSEKPAPKCHICGSAMTIQRAGAGGVVYGCTGRIDKDGEGYKFAEGRDFADDHYARSRVTVADESDSDVLALLDELEAKDSTIATQQQEIRTLLNALGQASEKRNAEQAVIIAKQEKWIKDIEATMITATDRAEAAEKRIAELEACEVLLPPKAPDNLASCLDGYEKWLIATTFRDTWNACLAEVVRVNAAAGKGE